MSIVNLIDHMVIRMQGIHMNTSLWWNAQPTTGLH